MSVDESAEIAHLLALLCGVELEQSDAVRRDGDRERAGEISLLFAQPEIADAVFAGESEFGGSSDHDAVAVTSDAAIGYGKAELLPLLVDGTQIEPGHAQPANGQGFQGMANLKDA